MKVEGRSDPLARVAPRVAVCYDNASLPEPRCQHVVEEGGLWRLCIDEVFDEVWVCELHDALYRTKPGTEHARVLDGLLFEIIEDDTELLVNVNSARRKLVRQSAHLSHSANDLHKAGDLLE